MTRRAQLVCDSPGSVQNETDYLNNVFSKNNYNTDFVRRNTHSNANILSVMEFIKVFAVKSAIYLRCKTTKDTLE